MGLQNSRFFKYICASLILVPQVTLAQLATAVKATEEVAASLAVNLPRGTVENLGLKSASLSFTKNGDILLKFLNKEGELVRQFDIAKSTPEALEAAKPSSLMQRMVTARMARDKKANRVVTAGLEIAGSHLMQFPIQAFTFFIALGAVSTQDLIFNYASNPAAYDVYLDGQKDPVNQIGFAAFNVASGLTTQPLMAAVKSNAVRRFLPSLGMSVGFTASQIVSELAAIPGARESMLLCAHGQILECDKSFKSFIDYNYLKMGQKMMPSLVSMLASTVLIGAVKSVGAGLVFSAATSGAISQTVKVLGVKIIAGFAEYGNEVGWAINGLMWTAQVAEFAGFLDTSNWIEVPLTHFWNNFYVIGRDVNNIPLRIYKNLKDNRLEKLPGDLQKFSQVMNSWRENNSMDVLTAHNQWVTYLSELSGKYNMTKRFYSNFINDAWSFKFQPDEGDTINILRTFPLYGVKTTTGKDVTPLQYLSLQDVMEQEQIKSLNATSTLLSDYISKNKKWFADLAVDEKSMVIELIKDFGSKDLTVLNRGLNVLNMLTWDYQHPVSPLVENKEPQGQHSRIILGSTLRDLGIYSANLMKDGLDPVQSTYQPDATFSSLMQYLVDRKVGHSTPFLQPGEGYLNTLASIYDSEGLINMFPDEGHYVNTPTAPEYLMTSMVMGPDATKESIVGTNHIGFKSEFIPPRLVFKQLGDAFLSLRDFDATTATKKESYYADIYHLNFAGTAVVNKDNLANPVEVMLSATADRSVFGMDPADAQMIKSSAPVHSNWVINTDDAQATDAMVADAATQARPLIDDWWTMHVEPQYLNAWADYDKKYQPIIKMLYKDLWKDTTEFGSNTAYSNGLVASTNQEISFYLSLLWHFAGDPTVTVKQTRASENPYGQDIANIQKAGRDLEDQLRNMFVETPHQNPNATGRKAIYYTTTVNHIPNADLQTASEAINKQITDLIEGKLMKNQSNASPLVQEVLKTLEANLIASFGTLATYGQIINVANYDARYSSGKDSGAESLPMLQQSFLQNATGGGAAPSCTAALTCSPLITHKNGH